MRRLWLLGPACVAHTPDPQENRAKSEGHEGQANSPPRFRSRRTVALLGYLVTERRAVARDFLAALFWPDEATSKGRSNLRRELHNLAQILPGCWELDRQAVRFVPSANVEVDLDTFLQLEAEERWQEAADLLGGQFLEGLSLCDNLEFENWLLGERERWQGRAEAVLARVIEGHVLRGRYTDALRYARRLLQIAPWNEVAHRQAMRLLAWMGQRGAALRQFEACQRALWEQVGVEPSRETAILYQQIEAGELDLPPQLPTFLTEEGARHEVHRPLFVTRERELAQLDAFLHAALNGKSRVIFVTGGPGRGKTALMDAFARRALQAHPHLLVASGNCSAYSGVGDPYLPFRDVMAMLTGDLEAKWDAGAITRDHAQRLWAAFPHVAQAIVEHGLHLLNVLVPGDALLSRTVLLEPARAQWLPRLRAHVSRLGTMSRELEQRDLFQQVTNVLRAIAQEQPLLLILDDIQWADVASVSLLFHLGRRIAEADTKILTVCAYRPEEVALTRTGPSTGSERDQRHPLAGALSEFRRVFGNVWVDLDRADRIEGRRFIDALLDAEPHRLSGDFRSALFHRTEGHPLFTVELLRAMQDRGDLLQDEDKCWIEGTALDWEALPARVEAVIAERIDRLDPELQELLHVASVEGETFTAQVVARVRQMAEGTVLHRLSQDLERQHRLVREQEEAQTKRTRMPRYRFGHVLFRDYVYNMLSRGERRLLHADVGAALESLYDGQQEEVAVQLAHHFQKAGNYGRAFRYLILAAERASRLYANDEAIAHYTRAIEVAKRVSPDTTSLAKLHRGRGLAREKAGDFDGARADHKANLEVARATGERHVEWCALLDLGKLWASRDYARARGYFEQALEHARDMDDPEAVAASLNWMGNWHANAEDPRTAVAHHQQALEIVEALGDRRYLANTLDLLGLAHLLGGDMNASISIYDRAIALSRELDDRPRLVSGLIARAVAVSGPVMLALAPVIHPPDALRDFAEALGIAREIDSRSDQAWAHWALGLLHTVQGRFGLAMKTMHRGLCIASEIEHREYQVANRCGLGMLYVELLAPERALRQLEKALSLAEALRSRLWMHHITGTLAGTYRLLDDLADAQTCLDAVLSQETPMDTMGNRYCWARRAEVALGQGDPALALDIVERLIVSAPGMTPGGVISFLWKLKGEALAGMGHLEEAQTLLQAATENARATGERFLLWRLHASLGRLYCGMAHQPEAAAEFSHAHELVEELAESIPRGELRESFLRRAHDELRPPA